MKDAKNIAVIVGARPQFIKIALLVNELNQKSAVNLIHTGQHYDYELSQSFFDQANIPEPSHNLGVGSGTHGHQTGEMLKEIEKIFLQDRPDLVVVVGDTNSTLAGALAASKLHIPIAHVEAGMRNFDRKKPEEINRILTDHVTDYFFAPTPTSKENLNKEGIHEHIYLVGDISNDLFVRNIQKAENESSILADLQLHPKDYHVVTIHKSINTDSKKNLEAILSTLSAANNTIVFPVHPRTKKFIDQYRLNHYLDRPGIVAIKPLSYFDMIKLMHHSKKIITDSGGIQKEAYALKIPCITLRKTEWVETVKEGWNCEVDIHQQKEFLDCINHFQPATEQSDFLGNGNTYKTIANIIWEKILS